MFITKERKVLKMNVQNTRYQQSFGMSLKSFSTEAQLCLRMQSDKEKDLAEVIERVRAKQKNNNQYNIFPIAETIGEDRCIFRLDVVNRQTGSVKSFPYVSTLKAQFEDADRYASLCKVLSQPEPNFLQRFMSRFGK